MDDDLNITEGLSSFRDWYQRLLEAMGKRFVLCHGDFRPNNLMLKQDILLTDVIHLS